MKILLATGIYPPDAGGPATYTRALARSLMQAGHSVQVVAYGDADSISSDDGYRVQRIGRNRDVLTRYWNFFIAVFYRARECDVVYLQGPVSEGLPATLAALLVGAPLVMKIVGDYAWEVYAGNGGTELLDEFLTRRHTGKIWFLEMIERFTAKRAKRVIVPSNYLKRVVESWGVPSDRTTVIYNAVEPLPAGRNRDEARAAFGLADQRVIFTAVRAVPWKGGDFLIRLLSDLPEDVILAIAGDGPSLDSWKHAAEEAGVVERVWFLGRLNRVALGEWYRAADIFTLASGYEGFAFAAVEAASVGLPCFVSDKGGNPEAKELLPGVVTVLPYQDRAAWLAAFSAPWPERSTATSPDALRFETMIKQTLEVLQKTS